MERKLLLLGLLRAHEMHGYQLNELIEHHLGASVQLKKPTAYRLLNRMTADGWITYREEQEGNRPQRRVYAITPPGETAFQRFLRESLAKYTPVDFLGNVGLMFLDEVPVAEALSLLSRRRAAVEGLLQVVHAHGGHQGGSERMLANQVRHLTTELEWLDDVIGELRSGCHGGPQAEGLAAKGHAAPHADPDEPPRDQSGPT